MWPWKPKPQQTSDANPLGLTGDEIIALRKIRDMKESVSVDPDDIRRLVELGLVIVATQATAQGRAALERLGL